MNILAISSRMCEVSYLTTLPWNIRSEFIQLNWAGGGNVAFQTLCIRIGPIIAMIVVCLEGQHSA